MTLTDCENVCGSTKKKRDVAVEKRQRGSCDGMYNLQISLSNNQLEIGLDCVHVSCIYSMVIVIQMILFQQQYMYESK